MDYSRRELKIRKNALDFLQYLGVYDASISEVLVKAFPYSTKKKYYVQVNLMSKDILGQELMSEIQQRFIANRKTALLFA